MEIAKIAGGIAFLILAFMGACEARELWKGLFSLKFRRDLDRREDQRRIRRAALR